MSTKRNIKSAPVGAQRASRPAALREVEWAVNQKAEAVLTTTNRYAFIQRIQRIDAINTKPLEEAKMSPAKKAKKMHSSSEKLAAKPKEPKINPIYAEIVKSLAEFPREDLEASLPKLLYEGEAENPLSLLEDSYKVYQPDIWLQILPFVSSMPKAEPFKDLPKDIWTKILSFVGPGQFLYVALVSTQFKELYRASFGTEDTKGIHDLPMVKDDDDDDDDESESPAVATNTFYSSAFSKVACARFWDKITRGKSNRLHNDRVCPTIVKLGTVHVLKWAHHKGFQWDRKTTSAAAQVGNLDCLKYAHDNGCGWDADTCDEAAKYGHLECLKYAHEKGCEWGRSTCARAAGNGHLECLKYAHENGCDWSPRNFAAAAAAARGGHLEVLKWTRANGFAWDAETCKNAAGGGHLEVLQWARARECPWDEDTCNMAARNGHLQVLQWARAQDCPWNEFTCAMAALGGHLEVLQWARANGCAWDEFTCYGAAGGGHLEVLQWASANRCPFNVDTCKKVAKVRSEPGRNYVCLSFWSCRRNDDQQREEGVRRSQRIVDWLNELSISLEYSNM